MNIFFYSDDSEIDFIKKQIILIYKPTKIVLFGSQAKGTATSKSDIDICIINDTDDKRSLLTDMYLNIESTKPFDFLLYTQEEWEKCISDSTSFAYQINKYGKVLYG